MAIILPSQLGETGRNLNSEETKAVTLMHHPQPQTHNTKPYKLHTHSWNNLDISRELAGTCHTSQSHEAKLYTNIQESILHNMINTEP